MIELIHCDKYVKLTGHDRPGTVGLDNYVSVDYSCCIFDLFFYKESFINFKIVTSR